MDSQLLSSVAFRSQATSGDPRLSPVQVTFLRLVLGAAVLSPIVLARRESLPLPAGAFGDQQNLGRTPASEPRQYVPKL